MSRSTPSPPRFTKALVLRRPRYSERYEKLLWREAHQALTAAAESGWRTAHPYVWGGALGNRQMVHGQPGDYLTLLFCFPAGEPVYAKLVGTPRLAAIVTADREQRRFLSVRFLNRP
jgi:hypothetical protein